MLLMKANRMAFLELGRWRTSLEDGGPITDGFSQSRQLFA